MSSSARKRRPPEPWQKWSIFFLTGLLFAMLLTTASCSTIKNVDRQNTEYRDTTTYKKNVKDSLIYVPIPLEKNQAIVEIGDTSRLETSVAKSEAYINANGRLCHTLENKREKLPALVPVTSTIITHGVTSHSTHTITNVQWRDKPLSAWKAAKIGAFWWLVAAVLLLLLWTFRKPILKLLHL